MAFVKIQKFCFQGHLGFSTGLSHDMAAGFLYSEQSNREREPKIEDTVFLQSNWGGDILLHSVLYKWINMSSLHSKGKKLNKALNTSKYESLKAISEADHNTLKG